MKWTISFYDPKVMKAIIKWPAFMLAKFNHIIELIENYGPQDVGMPLIKAMGDGLFEIRVNSKEGIARAMFCMLKAREMVILHGVVKKSQKTPLKDLIIARKRLREILNEKKTNI